EPPSPLFVPGRAPASRAPTAPPSTAVMTMARITERQSHRTAPLLPGAAPSFRPLFCGWATILSAPGGNPKDRPSPHPRRRRPPDGERTAELPTAKFPREETGAGQRPLPGRMAGPAPPLLRGQDGGAARAQGARGPHGPATRQFNASLLAPAVSSRSHQPVAESCGPPLGLAILVPPPSRRRHRMVRGVLGWPRARAARRRAGAGIGALGPGGVRARCGAAGVALGL